MDQDAFLARLRTHRAPPARVEPSSPPKPSEKELADRFCQELEAVGGVVHRVSSLDQARERVTQTLHDLEARRIIRTRARLFEELKLDRALFEAGVEVIVYDLKARSPEALGDAAFSARVGITAVDYGVAETGTLALLTRPGEGRAVSLVPPIHLGLLRARDIVLELGELFERVDDRHGGLPSALTFVTGPSCTADIEQVHTVGVHGPRELHLVLLD